MKAVVLGLALVAAPAYAGHGGGGSCSHGGGGGGGGSYSGGGGSTSSSSSSTSSGGSTESKGCSETTDIEGYRECVGFGAWADNMTLPRIVIEVGSNVRQFSSPAPGAAGSVTHGDETFAYRVAMPASRARAETAVTMPARMAVVFEHGLYVGVEGEIGGLATTAPVTAEMLSSGTYGSPVLDASGATFLGGYGVAGVRGGTSRFAVAAEMAGGVRDLEYRFDSTYHDCQQTSTIDVVRAVVEARARAEVWVYPWASIGAQVGTSVLEHGDWMAGVYVGLHSRAYGGLR